MGGEELPLAVSEPASEVRLGGVRLAEGLSAMAMWTNRLKKEVLTIAAPRYVQLVAALRPRRRTLPVCVPSAALRAQCVVEPLPTAARHLSGW